MPIVVLVRQVSIGTIRLDFEGYQTKGEFYEKRNNSKEHAENAEKSLQIVMLVV